MFLAILKSSGSLIFTWSNPVAHINAAKISQSAARDRLINSPHGILSRQAGFGVIMLLSGMIFNDIV